MSRARVPESLLAGLATAVAAWPVSTLFTPATWVRPTLAVIAVVVVCGMLARMVTTSWVLVSLAQVAGVVLASGGLYGRGHLWHGLPTLDMVLSFNILLVDARQTIQNYAAPAPTNRGVILGIGLAIAVTAIVVDHLAVMRRSPAMAGLPLLTAFLLSASNSGSSLHPVYFIAAAGVWLLMLGRQGISSLRRWSTTVPMSVTGRRSNDDRDGAYGYAAVGRTLGVAGLVTALVLPVVIPHFPTRFLIDGLGRSAEGTGVSDGQISLRTTLDLKKSLEDPKRSVVLTYTTNAPSVTPLRVTIQGSYANDQWRASRRSDIDFSRRTTVPPPQELDASVPRETYRISVENSRLEAPQIAAPTPLVSGDLDRVPWGLDPETSVAVVNRPASSYSFGYLQLRPRTEALSQPVGGDVSGIRDEDLFVDPASADLLSETLSQIVPAGADRIETARAIQKYLRTGGGFGYSLKLPDTVTNEFGQAERPDAITLFLRSKIGYCVQFATAMVMLARTAGIPARLATGFLPGAPDQGTYTVRTSDAHAWPELYFRGVGWLRFEPTPSGTQNTVAPGYSLDSAIPGTPTGTATTTAGPTSTAAPTDRPGDNSPELQDPTTANGGSVLDSLLGPETRTVLLWLALGLLVGLCGALAVPLAARSRLRRRLREAPDDARRVEVEWQSMIERIGDLGVIPPRGSTPRQAGRFFQREAYLEGEQTQALARIVDGVERSRYARPGTTVTDLRQEAHTIVRAVSGVRRRKDRIRAAWWPSEGVTEWRERREAVGRAVRQPWERLQERLDERRERREDRR